MRFFANFDTKHKMRVYRDYQNEFGKDQVLLVTKGSLYWIIYVFLPTLLIAVLFGLGSIIVLYTISDTTIRLILLGFMALVAVFSIVPIIDKYISYKMDFLIVSPRYIVKYDQIGFLERDGRTLNTANIKTITFRNDSLLKSIWDSGDIVFLSESGEEGGIGSIRIRYVKKPEQLRAKISQIIKKVL